MRGVLPLSAAGGDTLFKRILKWLKNHKRKREKEYHKRMLNFILINAIGMMWCSYILAWFGKTSIAETLSKTVATAIVGVVIPYFITKTIENVSKYGSKLNHTADDDTSIRV